MFLLETKNLTKIVKGYNKKSELHVSPAGVRVGASASLRVSCVGTSRHQKGTKAPSKCFKCYTLLRPIICIMLSVPGHRVDTDEVLGLAGRFVSQCLKYVSVGTKRTSKHL